MCDPATLPVSSLTHRLPLIASALRQCRLQRHRGHTEGAPVDGDQSVFNRPNDLGPGVIRQARQAPQAIRRQHGAIAQEGVGLRFGNGTAAVRRDEHVIGVVVVAAGIRAANGRSRALSSVAAQPWQTKIGPLMR